MNINYIAGVLSYKLDKKVTFIESLKHRAVGLSIIKYEMLVWDENTGIYFTNDLWQSMYGTYNDSDIGELINDLYNQYIDKVQPKPTIGPSIINPYISTLLN